MNKNIYYKGNIKLKRSGVIAKLTHHQIDEYKKCKNNPIYFIENYCKIITLDYGERYFKMYDYQKRMATNIFENQFTIFKLPRQYGKSSLVAGVFIHYAIFNKSKRLGIIANKSETAKETLERIKLMYENLPFFLQVGVDEWNKSSIEFGNGSKILAAATTSSSLRGKSLNMILIDEMAFIRNFDEFYTSTYPVISAGKTSKIIIVSTPLGLNSYYRFWMDAINGRSEYVPLDVKWNEHPDRDEVWKEKQIRNTSQDQFDQEFNCAFLGSSDTLISGSKLKQLVWQEPIRNTKNYKVYKNPEENRTYIVTVDVAEGLQQDSSVVNVIDITETPYQQIAVYKNNEIAPQNLADVSYKIAKNYNEAYILVESNSLGHETVTCLFEDYEYENLLKTKAKGGINTIDMDDGDIEYKLGIKTTAKTKRIGCSNLKRLLEENILIINDSDTIQEIQNFVKVNNTYKADEGYNDDIVMTLVLFAWLSVQTYFKDLTNIDTTKLLNKNFLSVHDEIPLFITDGSEGDNFNIEELDYEEMNDLLGKSRHFINNNIEGMEGFFRNIKDRYEEDRIIDYFDIE